MALILRPEGYLTLDLALPPEVWSLLDEYEDDDERAILAEHFRLAYVCGFHARDKDSPLMRDLTPDVILDPCESTP